MSSLLYKILELLSPYLGKSFLIKVRMLGNSLSGLGTGNEREGFYRAIEESDLIAARRWLDNLIGKVGDLDPEYIRMEKCYFDALYYFESQQEEVIEIFEEERVKTFLKTAIQQTCKDPDEEPTELFLDEE